MVTIPSEDCIVVELHADLFGDVMWLLPDVGVGG